MPPRTVAAAGLAALAVGMGIGRFAFTPILPLMQAEGALTLASGGWLAAGNYAGYLAGALLAPLLPTAIGVRAGLAGVALFTLAMPLVQQVGAWILLRALAGVASAWVLVHVSAWTLERLALARPELSGVVYAGVGAGSVVAGLVCLGVLELRLDADSAWVALGVTALLATVMVWPLFTDSRRGGSQVRPFRWNGTAILLASCYAAFGFGYIIPATFIPALARETLGEARVYAWAWPIFGVAAAASTVAVVPVVRRLGERAVWVGGHLVMAAGVVAPLALPGVVGIAASALCVGATFVVVTMAGLQEARRLAGAGLLAGMTAAFAAGQIAGPAFVSLLAHAGGRLEHASLAASLVLVVSALVLLVRRTQP